MEMASNGALKRAVAGGLGVTVLSTQAVRLELAMGLLHPLTVAGFPVRRLWHVAWAHDRVLSPAATDIPGAPPERQLVRRLDQTTRR